MRFFLLGGIAIFSIGLIIYPHDIQADTLSAYDYDIQNNIVINNGSNSESLWYLKAARAYRNAGRYELARQSYVQALSLCANSKTLNTIRSELAGVQMLIRTMR